MGIAATSPAAIKAALITAIEGLTPSETDYQDFAWRYVAEARVQGTAIRTFTILHGPPTETIDGIHGGDGIEYEYEMRIRTAYGGLSGDDMDVLIFEDARDLWLLLHPLPSGGAGAIAGLLSFRGPLDPVSVEDDDGHRLIDYTLEVHFKASDS